MAVTTVLRNRQSTALCRWSVARVAVTCSLQKARVERGPVPRLAHHRPLTFWNVVPSWDHCLTGGGAVDPRGRKAQENLLSAKVSELSGEIWSYILSPFLGRIIE